MRWQQLFADLEAQADALDRAELAAEIAERTRGEFASITLASRLRAQVGHRLSLSLGSAGDLSGHLARVGADWLLLECPDDVLVPLGAVTALWDLPPHAVADDRAGAVALRLPLGSALRAIARDRAEIRIARRDGTELSGTPDRVGSDFVDLAIHGRGAAPRRSEVKVRATVPFAAIGQLRRLPAGWG